MEYVTILALILLILNIFSFFYYGIDKRKAIAEKRRISEKNLLIASAVAPFGATAGMHIWHHKTRKTKFKLVYVFLILHIILLFILLH